jgi:hypothetical protein
MARSPQHVLQVTSPTDYALYEFVSAIIGWDEVAKVYFDYGPGYTQVVENIEQLKYLRSEENPQEGRFVQNLTISTNGDLKLLFNRGRTIPGGNGYTLEKSVYEAEFFFEPLPRKGESLPPVDRKKFNKTIREYFSLFVESDADASRTTNAVFDRALGDLSAIAAKVAQDLTDTQRSLTEESQKFRRSLQEEYSKKREDLFAEVEEANESLNQQKDQLLTEKKKLLDKSARHERRTLRASITADLRKRLSSNLTPRNVSAQRLISYMIAIGIAGVALFVLTDSIEFLDFYIDGATEALETGARPLSPQTFYIMLFRALASSAVAVATGFYIIKMLRRDASEDLKYQRAVERFALDVDRASWLVETVLEFDGKDMSVPEVWLHNASANLFDSEQTEPSEASALEALGELLSAGAEVKVANGLAEVNIPARASRRIGKSG